MRNISIEKIVLKIGETEHSLDLTEYLALRDYLNDAFKTKVEPAGRFDTSELSSFRQQPQQPRTTLQFPNRASTEGKDGNKITVHNLEPNKEAK